MGAPTARPPRLQDYRPALEKARLTVAARPSLLATTTLTGCIIRAISDDAVTAGGGYGIDQGPRCAFLGVAACTHGARPMESIVDMSALSGKSRYERSALPAPYQLGLHVDAERFLALVKGAPPE